MATAAAGEPIDRIRVKNGYGLKTSALSASVIGRFDASSEKRQAINRSWEHRYDKDAEFQMAQLQGNHPVRKVLHMQKCYPETVRRLNNKKQRGGSPPCATSSATPISSRWCRGVDKRSTFQSQQPKRDVPVSSETEQRVAREYQFCRAKMVFNRTKGREAEVDGILTGKSPVSKKYPLFPARATHQQLLGLVHQPSYPDRPAPDLPRERKWLGDNVGWEGNRGLPTPQAGRSAKDGEVWPWPSSQFPSVPGDPASL